MTARPTTSDPRRERRQQELEMDDFAHSMSLARASKATIWQRGREFTGGRATNVSERVSFDVVKVAKGLRVTVKGRPLCRVPDYAEPHSRP